MTKDPHEQDGRLPLVAKQACDEQFLLALNQHLESWGDISLPTARPDLPIIYVVGAPRSGTTLMSQVLSRCLRVGYIDNLVARFWLSPEVGVRLSRILLGDNARASIDFWSRHGVTESMAGPHEFGYFWRHWLLLDRAQTHHLTQDEIDRVDAAGLKSVLECRLLGALGMPLLFKNVICGFQAPLLVELHPCSIFIHIKRNLRDTAASILKSRSERYGSYGAWWSLKPSTFADFPSDPVQQVVAQVVDCRAELDAAIARSGARTLNVEYADFCSDPNQVVDQVCELLLQFGIELAPLARIEPFLVAGTPAVPAEMMNSLNAEIARRNAC